MISALVLKVQSVSIMVENIKEQQFWRLCLMLQAILRMLTS